MILGAPSVRTLPIIYRLNDKHHVFEQRTHASRTPFRAGNEATILATKIRVTILAMDEIKANTED